MSPFQPFLSSDFSEKRKCFQVKFDQFWKLFFGQTNDVNISLRLPFLVILVQTKTKGLYDIFVSWFIQKNIYIEK